MAFHEAFAYRESGDLGLPEILWVPPGAAEASGPKAMVQQLVISGDNSGSQASKERPSCCRPAVADFTVGEAFSCSDKVILCAVCTGKELL